MFQKNKADPFFGWIAAWNSGNIVSPPVKVVSFSTSNGTVDCSESFKYTRHVHRRHPQSNSLKLRREKNYCSQMDLHMDS